MLGFGHIGQFALGELIDFDPPINYEASAKPWLIRSFRNVSDFEVS